MPELNLPPGVKDALDALIDSLTRAVGADLAAVLVFGSAARGAYEPGTSDVDLCVVLRKTSPEVLRKAANPLVLARNTARIEAVLLRDDEIGRAADAFPLFYDDIRRAHVTLHGDDPFATLEIADAHKRVRVEQELREAQIRLRRAAVDGLFAERPLRGAVIRKLRQLRSPLRAMFELFNVDAPDELGALLTLAAERWGLSVAPLLDPAADAGAAHEALAALLDRAVDEVDKLGGAP
ncbi:MAG: nucleotidyltransferase domain-containing protein [Polyangiaceae bacterium]|nr:nucleotidyltransferase domain-containing protein [Polyangiaceae bacterium]